jgi:hypothetical protein
MVPVRFLLRGSHSRTVIDHPLTSHGSIPCDLRVCSKPSLGGPGAFDAGQTGQSRCVVRHEAIVRLVANAGSLAAGQDVNCSGGALATSHRVGHPHDVAGLYHAEPGTRSPRRMIAQSGGTSKTARPPFMRRSSSRLMVLTRHTVPSACRVGAGVSDVRMNSVPEASALDRTSLWQYACRDPTAVRGDCR